MLTSLTAPADRCSDDGVELSRHGQTPRGADPGVSLGTPTAGKGRNGLS